MSLAQTRAVRDPLCTAQVTRALVDKSTKKVKTSFYMLLVVARQNLSRPVMKRATNCSYHVREDHLLLLLQDPLKGAPPPTDCHWETGMKLHHWVEALLRGQTTLPLLLAKSSQSLQLLRHQNSNWISYPLKLS